MKLWAIRDRKAEEIYPPFVAKNLFVGIRMGRAAMSKSQFPIEDFELLEIGEMDMETGHIKGLEHIKANSLGSSDDVE